MTQQWELQAFLLMESLGLLNYALSKFEIEVACQELFRSLKKVVKRILMFRQTVGWELKRSGRLILPWLNISQFMRKKLNLLNNLFALWIQKLWSIFMSGQHTPEKVMFLNPDLINLSLDNVSGSGRWRNKMSDYNCVRGNCYFSLKGSFSINE